MRRSNHASHIVMSHRGCSQVKSCESARVSAETVSGGSVVAMGVDGKDGIVVRKDGYAKRCRGLNYVMIVSPQFDTRGSDLSYFRLSSRPLGRSALALPGVVVLGPVVSASTACIVLVCVEKSGVPLMSSTWQGCWAGARWSRRGATRPAACCRCASRWPQPSRRSCCGMSRRSASGSTTSSTTAAMHLPECFHLGFLKVGQPS